MTAAQVSSRACRVAIAHDDLTQRGGAERVVLSLHRLFPDAPIFTSAFDPHGTYPEFAALDVRTTFLQRLPHRGAASRALLPLYPAAMARIDVRGFDLVISSSSRFAHGVTAPEGAHVTYCHNPPRFLHQADEYFREGAPVPPWSRPLLSPALAALRRWDRRAATRPDLYVANSHATARRIEQAYGRTAHVVNPPVDLGRFDIDPRPSAYRVPTEPYYVALARLLPYKRIDLAAAACRRLGRRLIVVGDGPAEESVRRAGGTRVEIRGGVPDAELVALLRNCTALVQPGLEDFGLAPLEANAAGRPAVAFGGGGALEAVVDGTTGVLFAEQTVEALCAAIRRAETIAWDTGAIRRHATSRGEPGFHAQILELVDDLLGSRTGGAIATAARTRAT